MKNKIVLAIHEATGQDITFGEVAYALNVGGGKPGQGYPCILVVNEDDNIDREEVLRMARG